MRSNYVCRRVSYFLCCPVRLSMMLTRKLLTSIIVFVDDDWNILGLASWCTCSVHNHSFIRFQTIFWCGRQWCMEIFRDFEPWMKTNEKQGLNDLNLCFSYILANTRQGSFLCMVDLFRALTDENARCSFSNFNRNKLVSCPSYMLQQHAVPFRVAFSQTDSCPSLV